MSRAHRRRILMSNRHRLSKAEAAAMRKVFAAKRRRAAVHRPRQAAARGADEEDHRAMKFWQGRTVIVRFGPKPKAKKRLREAKAEREKRHDHIATVIRALVNIAAFDDGDPNARDITEMSRMDEPHSALKAREALDEIGYRHPR